MMDIILNYSEETLQIVFLVIGIASTAIKFLPELPETHWAKPIVRFIGKHIALNRKSPTALSISLNR